jgi:colanic acid/amylovoran biosynthesis glycosyltransferase
LKPKLVAAVKRLKLGPRIEIKDPALGGALRDEFARASVFVAPYKEATDGDSDGVPNVVLEALAWGVPVIARGAAALNEKILFAAQGEKADESLAREFEHVLKDPALLRERTDAAREWVAERYDCEKNIQPLIDVLEKSST